VALTVEDRELLVLVGPSGCGKTTLLRLIAGLDQPDSGRMVLTGRDLTGVQPADRNIALVFQNPSLYPSRTVYENLAFALRLKRLPRTEIDTRIRQMATRLGLQDVLSVRPGQLSGGQQQRVALGRALVRRPALFLLDEPLSNLDSALRRDLRQLLKQLQRELGTPAIHVTHDQEEALSLADRLVVMNAGRVLQVGTPTEVYREPGCRFVAGFLGSPPMNFLPGELIARDGRVEFSGPARLDLSSTPWAGKLLPQVGRSVVLGIRPEALGLAPANSQAFSLSGKVHLVEPLGARTDVTVEVVGSRVTARLEVSHAPEVGEQVHLYLHPEACHWFEPGPEGPALVRVR
jgi:multiple sugar transport system ATP-binding protein